MMTRLKLILLLCGTWYLMNCYGNVMGSGLSNFIMEEFYWCKEVPVQKLKLFITPKNFNKGVQMVDINLTLPYPIGNEILMKGVIEADTQMLTKHSWVHLIDVVEGTCKILHTYFGQFWYDMETALGIMPQSCPLPRGSYHAMNYRMDYQKMKLQTFPFGKIKVRISTNDTVKKETLMCIEYIISNIP